MDHHPEDGAAAIACDDGQRTGAFALKNGKQCFFHSLFVNGIIGLVLSKRATKSMIVLIVSLIAIDVAIVGAYFGTQQIVERIGETTLQTEDRDEVAGYALNMWKDYPVFGSGLGSFPVVFPRYSADGTAAS